jgi:hypothetical protein
MAVSMSDVKSSAVQSRICGSCSLCCKLIGFAELNKPMGQWCPHFIKGSGCSIYESRPDECRSFNCQWLINERFGDEWEPTRSKIVICHVWQGDTSKLVFNVDPGSPLSWKKEPYYSQLKRLALNGLEHKGIITVNVAKRVFVVLPNEDVDLGVCDVDDNIVVQKEFNGSDWEIRVFTANPETEQ